MEKWIEEAMNLIGPVLPKWLGKEDYDRVLLAAKQYPNCSPENTRFLIDVIRIALDSKEEYLKKHGVD